MRCKITRFFCRGRNNDNTRTDCVLGLQLRNQIKISIWEITYEKTYDRYCKLAKNCLVLKLTIAIEIAIEEKLPYQGLM